jgi:chromosome partitioning protein
MINRQISPIRESLDLDILAVTPNMIQESMQNHNEHRTLVENLNREFKPFLPEYAQVDTEIFDALDDPSQSVDHIPKPGIRKRTAISRAFKQGQPVSAYDEECDQISNFDHLAELVEARSNAQ